MQEIINQYKNNGGIHHFHILIGDKQNSREEIINFCNTEFGCQTIGNQFFVDRDFDRLLIDDAKDISSRSIIKNTGDEKQVFCISFNDITREAQNSLLKIIEEPSKETYFFLISPRKDIFLPTVLSRAMVVEIESESSNDLINEISQDLLSDKSVGEKLKVVDSLVKKIKDKKVEKGIAREIVKKIIIELEKDLVNNSDSLKTLQKIDDYLGDTSCSVKLLLERVVLSLD
jgi:DNA polymerase-3 subunit delta'